MIPINQLKPIRFSFRKGIYLLAACKNPRRKEITIKAIIRNTSIPIKIKTAIERILVSEPFLILPPQFGQLLAFEEICLPQVAQ
jgi:hypothetical protein